MERTFDPLNGEILLLDKDLDWTSFDVVNKVRNLLKRYLGIPKIKVGHAGTLDPMATGLLILCTGKMTKRIDDFQGLPKTYDGSIRFGSTTPSLDLETEIEATFPTEHIELSLLREKAREFIGWIDQVPPAFSAKRKDGKRAYKQARKGRTPDLDPQKVHIQDLEISNFENNEATFRVTCSKGTYIRSLARDLGKEMESGAFLSSLRRTSIGKNRIEDALTITQFEAFLQKVTEEGSERIRSPHH